MSLMRKKGSTPGGGAVEQKRAPKNDLSDDQKLELREAFELFDADKTGTIDLHELKVLMRALGFDVKKPEVVKMVHDVDPTNSGAVDYLQFLEIMADRYAERNPEEEIVKAFQVIINRVIFVVMQF